MPALVVLLVICFAAVIKYIRRASTGANQIAATQQQGQAKDETHPTNAAADNGATSTAGETIGSKSSKPAPQQGAESRHQREATGSFSKTENTGRNPKQQTPEIATVPGTVTETETRSIRAVRTTPLSAVKRVYVETVGDETLSQSVRQTLAERLRATNRIILAHNRDEADALLKVTVVKSTGGKPEKTNAFAELINPRGNVIWSNSSENYQGSAAEVSASIVRDLLAALKNSKQRK